MPHTHCSPDARWRTDAGGIRTLLVKLLSTAGTGFFYTTKRPRVALYKLAFRKYDPVGTLNTRARGACSAARPCPNTIEAPRSVARCPTHPPAVQQHVLFKEAKIK